MPWAKEARAVGPVPRGCRQAATEARPYQNSHQSHHDGVLRALRRRGGAARSGQPGDHPLPRLIEPRARPSTGQTGASSTSIPSRHPSRTSRRSPEPCAISAGRSSSPATSRPAAAAACTSCSPPVAGSTTSRAGSSRSCWRGWRSPACRRSPPPPARCAPGRVRSISRGAERPRPAARRSLRRAPQTRRARLDAARLERGPELPRCPRPQPADAPPTASPASTATRCWRSSANRRTSSAAWPCWAAGSRSESGISAVAALA
jgi:hypothetical protein